MTTEGSENASGIQIHIVDDLEGRSGEHRPCGAKVAILDAKHVPRLVPEDGTGHGSVDDYAYPVAANELFHAVQGALRFHRGSHFACSVGGWLMDGRAETVPIGSDTGKASACADQPSKNCSIDRLVSDLIRVNVAR